LIDWVDAADKPIATIPRSEVFLRRAGFRVVHVFVFNNAGELLLQQLGRNRERNPLKWGSSVAGYLNAGERYLDGAIRRLREELACDAPLTKFGSVGMLDQGARKFVTLYLASASDVAMSEPEHIENLRFERVADVSDWLLASPEDFTETFRFLFRFYLSTLGLMREAL
jgi:hypothetical protein